MCGLRAMSGNDMSAMPTIWFLMGRYGHRAVIPLDLVCKDYFPHLTTTKLLQKCLRGSIKLPIVRIENSQKALRGVHAVDLANYIDSRRQAAIKECRQLCGDDI